MTLQVASVIITDIPQAISLAASALADQQTNTCHLQGAVDDCCEWKYAHLSTCTFGWALQLMVITYLSACMHFARSSVGLGHAEGSHAGCKRFVAKLCHELGATPYSNRSLCVPFSS